MKQGESRALRLLFGSWPQLMHKHIAPPVLEGQHMNKPQAEEVVVIETTDPDQQSIAKTASAIVSNRGGRFAVTVKGTICRSMRAGRTSYVMFTILAAVSLITLAASAWAAYDVRDLLTPDNIARRLEDAGAFGPAVLMLVMGLAVVVSPIPSLPLDMLAGHAFGPYWGTLYATLGATFGAVASFVIARLLGRRLVTRFLKGHINFCQRCSDKLLTQVVFFSRLIPFVSFDLVSYGAGLTQMSAWKFGVVTFLGTLPVTLFYTAYGASVLENSLISWVGGLVMIALFFLLPTLIDRYDLFGLKRYFRHGPETLEARTHRGN